LRENGLKICFPDEFGVGFEKRARKFADLGGYSTVRSYGERREALPRRIIAISRRNAMKKILQFLRADDGPTAVEYAVMLALIILICMAAIQSVGSQTSSSFTNSADSIGSAVGSS
jgi:pilus assembly protein Flp/PilA